MNKINKNNFPAFLKLALLVFTFFILNFSSVKNVSAEQIPDVEMGSVLVCKILVDENGNVINSNQVSQTNFSLKIADNKNFSNPDVNVSFSTNSFVLNEHFISNDAYDANCQTFELPFGQYYYSSETVSNPNAWGSSKYFDGLNFNSIRQAKEYSAELFNGDDGDDILTNITSDGFISISDENPYRSIIIINTYKNPSEQNQNNVISNDNFNLVVTSIVCDSESDLPNWGTGGADITATTSAEFLASHPNCRPASGWNYEYFHGYINNFVPNGSYIGPATTTGFITFGPTDNMGVASVLVSMPTTSPEVVSVREHLKDSYIPFKFDINTNPSNDDKYSAELYCHNDVYNYDNYDVVASPVKDKNYYCISFNVLKNNSINTPPLITLIGANPWIINVGDSFVDPKATSTDREDGDLTSSVVVSGAVNTTLSGTYTLTYTVTDSGGLSASTTRTVIVNPVIVPNDNVKIITTSIVCDSESDLPNWGTGGADITATTSAEFLASHPNCRPASGWNYQWGYKGVAFPVELSYIGEAPVFSAWTTFGPTNENGVVDIDIRMTTTSPIVIRQASKAPFIPFAGYNNGNFGAELYCHTDVFNYDNVEEILGISEGQTVYCISFNVLKEQTPINTPPIISLKGNNPMIITVGDLFIEPGATSTDREDGDITSRIVITGTVGITPGTYTLTYTVTDSGGLSASTTRTVIVKEPDVSPKGKVKFCAVFVDKNNVVQTTKSNLPFGNFNIKLATSTDINSSLVGEKSWSNTSFTPNQKIISTSNDADCTSFDNLPLQNYYYSQASVNGSLWKVVKYNDQMNVPVNNVFDLFNYSPELFNSTTSDDSSRNVNSDGFLQIDSSNREHTVVLLFSYDEPQNNQCLLPDITSELSVQATLNSQFSYQITASSSSSVTLDIGTSTLPSGLSFNQSTGIISGTPTEAGAFFLDVKPTNSCGTASSTRITIYVNTPSGGGGGGSTPPPAVITSGGGGGGNGPVNQDNLRIFNEKVVEVTSGVALVTWDTNLPATREVGYGTYSVVFASSTSPFGYATSTDFISSPLATTHSMLIPIGIDGTYYFRPVSKDSNRQVIGSELVLTRGGSSSSCYYLYDYLKKGWDNNPVEVKKLQVFLRDLEGFDVQITGVYDDQTIKALNAFQERYKDDILTPWGHKSATSFTYITTKKKVNEIYCKMAFPLTVQQQDEIDAFRNFLNNLKVENIVIPNDQSVDRSEQPIIIDTNEVGLGGNLEGSLFATSTDLSTLAGISNRTVDLSSSITASVIQSGKALGNLISKIFTWPFTMFNENQCKTCNYCNISKLIFIIIIIILTYLLYRERRAYKRLSEINKELDLINRG